MDDGAIRLADFLDNFRHEIVEAMDRAKQAPLQFRATKIELELQITAERAAGAEGKIEFRVLGSGIRAGGDGKAVDRQVHIVKVSLQPVLNGQLVDPLVGSDLGKPPPG